MKRVKPWLNKGLAIWTEGDTAYFSVAFTWRLDDAYQQAVFYKQMGYKIRAGGPGIFTRKHYLADVAEIGGDIPDAVTHHHPDATFASRGCDVGCWFCVVPKMEGKTYTLLPDFTPRPILCDNNLSALPEEYQRHIIEKYKGAGVPLLDANSGFEPRTFSEDVFLRWKEINKGAWRFAYDDMNDREHVERVMAMLRKYEVSPARIQVYTLIGNEPIGVCMGRIKEVIQWGGQPYAQPVMKLNALKKEPMVRHDWSRRMLIDVQRWANGRYWKYAPDFADYRRSTYTSKQIEPGMLI